MSDIGTPDISTVTCASCGAQNDSSASVCAACGGQLLGPDGDRRSDQLELEEAWRAVAASGFDADGVVAEGRITCPECSREVAVAEARVDQALAAVDTPTGRDDLLVVAYDCPECGAPIRAVVERADTTVGGDAGTTVGGDGAGLDDTPKLQEMADTGHDGEVPPDPVEAHPERFEAGEPGNLSDLMPLEDAEGDDIREYTGEPVETDEGWVIPQQQNGAGKDNIAGGGEWPDPATPPVQADPDQH